MKEIVSIARKDGEANGGIDLPFVSLSSSDIISTHPLSVLRSSALFTLKFDARNLRHHVLKSASPADAPILRDSIADKGGTVRG